MPQRIPRLVLQAGSTALACGALAAPAFAASLDAAELPAVEVKAEREATGSAADGYRHSRASAGFLGAVPLRELPYSLNVTSGELIENRAAHTVAEALKSNPTVASLMESSGYTSMSRVMIRGFTAADQNDQRDGLIDRSFAFVPLENVERIEVMNGFSGFLYGFSALGGSLNYVSKLPTPVPYASLSGGSYGGGVAYLHGDFGGRAGRDVDWGYRVNVYDESGSGYIDGSKRERDFVSALVDFTPAPGTRLQADIWHQTVGMQGLDTYINVNPAAGIHVPNAAAFSARRQYGQDWTYNQAEKTLLGVGLESELSEQLRFRTAFRYGDMWRDYLFVNAMLTDNAGHYSEKATGSTRQVEHTHSLYALFDASLQTGSLAHQLTFGYTGTDFYYSRGLDVSKTLGVSSIAAPVGYADPGLLIGPSNQASKTYYRNWVIGDRVAIGDDWQAIVGLNRAGLASPTVDQNRVTPSYALTYRWSPAINLYASYMEALVNGGTAPGTAANASQVLAPSVSDQIEFGAKTTLAGIDLNAALFRINKINEYLDPGDNVYKQDGREIHQGVEVTATGKASARLTMIGGLTWLDANYEKAKNNPALVGKIPVNVPERQARAYVEYLLPEMDGLILTAGANYFGRRPVDAANSEFLAAATTVDLGARYRTAAGGHPLTLRFNVSNLFDKAYWTYYRSGDGLLLGAPRLVSLTAKLEW